jgi:N-acetylneuraminic acid mutarotase
MHAASTVDGNVWTESPGIASISTRYGAAFAVFNNRLWLMGGTQLVSPGNVNYLNDVWSTADGVTWTQSPEPPFFGRANAQLFALNGRMFLLGGEGINVTGSDVWSTDDGISWRQDWVTAPFGVRRQHQVAVFNGRAWLLGGLEQTPDAWSSADGLTWTQEALNDTDVATRHDLKMVAFNNRLWVVGGVRRENLTTYTALNDVWSSADGNTWTRETGNANWSPRAEHAVAGFAGRLWLFGGEWLFVGGTNREVWQSADGIGWRLRYRNLIETP